MRFSDEMRATGYVEVAPGGNGVRVYYNNVNYEYINVTNVVDAYWTGGCTAIIVMTSDGRRMRWTGMDSYDYIY